MHDYLIIGVGVFGATVARILADNNKSVIVIDRRSHIVGNIIRNANMISMCICTERIFSILITGKSALVENLLKSIEVRLDNAIRT